MPATAATVVVALIGLPGAGKTRVADALVRELGLARICRDRVRAAMFPACTFTPAEKRAAFRAVLSALEVNCALGRSTVLDGMTFGRRADLEAVDRVLAAYPAQCLPILLDCPTAIARQRIAEQQAPHPAGDRTPALVDAVAARFDPPPAGCIVVDATQPAEVVAAAVVAVVRAAL